MNARKTLSLLMALAMLLALTACGGTSQPAATEGPAAAGSAGGAAATTETPVSEAPAEPPDDTVYTLVVNLNKGEKAAVQEMAFMDAVTQASNGRIQFDAYYSSSLLSAAEVPEGLESGVVDMAIVSASEYPSIIPLTSYLATMPFSGIQGTNYYAVYDQLLQEFPEITDEFTAAGMRLLTYCFASATNMFFVSDKTAVTKPGDIKGLQIIATASSLQTLISDCGGAPVSAGPGDFYSYLERSVSDGIVNHWGQVYNSALYEVVDRALIFGETPDSGITRDMNLMIMSASAWDSLPADLQALFEQCASVYQDTAIDYMEELTTNGLKALNDQGATVVNMTNDEVGVWSEAFAGIRDGILSDLDSQGRNATEIYNRMIEINESLG